MPDGLAEELAELRRVLQEQGRMLEERGRRLENHFAGDEEFQGGLARDVKEVAREVTALRRDFEVHKVRYDESQKRWRSLLDPAEGGELVPPLRGAAKVELNGALKQIIGVAVGAGGAAAAFIELLRWALANLPHP